MALEEEFNAEIPEEEAEKLQTVGAVIAYVEAICLLKVPVPCTGSGWDPRH